MPRAPTYAQAKDHLLTALQLQNWEVRRTDARGKTLKVPHATKGRARIYFKTQSLHFDCGPPFSLNTALSTHDDPRELAELVGDDSIVGKKMSDTLEAWCLRDNPRDYWEPAGSRGHRRSRKGVEDGEQEILRGVRVQTPDGVGTVFKVGEKVSVRFVGASPNDITIRHYLIGDVDPASNPIDGMPGGSVTACIKQHQDKDDPGAYCAAIADRIEPGWRGKGRKNNPDTTPASDLVRGLKF